MTNIKQNPVLRKILENNIRKYFRKPNSLSLKLRLLSDDTIEIESMKDVLTDFQEFLLKNGYCDSDTYEEKPSVIDRFLYPELNK